MSKVSDCCGASPKNINNDCDTSEFGICPECKDHCEYIEVEEEELDTVINCMVAMREAKEEARKRFGFKTWKSFEEAQERVMGAIPEGGIVSGKYRIIKATRKKFLVPLNQMTEESSTRLEIHDAR